MSDWFNEPFFQDNNNSNTRSSMPNDVFGDMNSVFDHFNKMHEQMNKMMKSAFSNSFFDDDFMFPQASLGYNDSAKNQRKPKVEEVDDSVSQNYTSHQPRIEEPDSDSDGYMKSKRSSSKSRKYDDDFDFHNSSSSSKKENDGKPYYYAYSSSQQAVYRPDGTVNMKRIDQDSTGKKHLAEMRKMGDKSVVYDRKIGTDGKPIDSVKPVGMTEADLDSFNQEYTKKLHAKIEYGLPNESKPTSHHSHAALGAPSTKPSTTSASLSHSSKKETTPTHSSHHHHHHHYDV